MIKAGKYSNLNKVEPIKKLEIKMIELTLQERIELFCKKYKKNISYGSDLLHEDLDKHDIPRKIKIKE